MLKLDIGNKIDSVSEEETGDMVLYTRYTSKLFDEDINGRENYIFGVLGVFPNGTTASMNLVEPGTAEYQDAIEDLIPEDLDGVRIVDFEVRNAKEEKIQPKTFFGDAIIGFRIPDDFEMTDNLAIIRIVADDKNIMLRSKTWVDPENPSLRYIKGTTDHFSPYAILSPWSDYIPKNPDNFENGKDDSDDSFWEVITGDQVWLWVTGTYTVLSLSVGLWFWLNRKNFKQIQ